ncbi:hypothetical protein BJ508DRAFT_323345 [Ascobolus immersus RN42]|uniref:Uncharacterized protein n=1 Tax=Ascobolus immersus RN42 TaxID=1160509 RepID=A0A3N4IJA5_ASCIM|nr:hypothetical protein BJ508DRAFT_323345 [Ascobolus immersus RN42]
MATLRNALFLSPTILHSSSYSLFPTSQPPQSSSPHIHPGSSLNDTTTPHDHHNTTVRIHPNYCRQLRLSIPSNLPSRTRILTLLHQHQSRHQPPVPYSPPRRLSTLGLGLANLLSAHQVRPPQATTPGLVHHESLKHGLYWEIMMRKYTRRYTYYGFFYDLFLAVARLFQRYRVARQEQLESEDGSQDSQAEDEEEVVWRGGIDEWLEGVF